MSLIVVLDSGPLGLLSNPRDIAETREGFRWLEDLLKGGSRIILPEIADYEVRRELIRAGCLRGIARLDWLGETLEYSPITTEILRQAAGFWAEARREGRPTAHPAALDGDVILAAQALDATVPGEHVVVATGNVRHVARYVAARHWRDIKPF
jgi:hypothetical protein